MKRLTQLIIPALILACAPIQPISAQTSSAARPDNQISNVGTMPSRGMSMARVEKAFGRPQRRLDPVGDPPITRWVYDGFTVYFEHHLVITSVVTGDTF